MTEWFQKYPKTPRLGNVQMRITEKIDGTNARLFIRPDRLYPASKNRLLETDSLVPITRKDGTLGFRTVGGCDNHGFAAWAIDNERALTALLGLGTFAGEWAGPGIQGNPLQLERKTFFLFRTPNELALVRVPDLSAAPELYVGPFDTGAIQETYEMLMDEGSHITHMATPEGIIVEVLGQRIKVTPHTGGKGRAE